MMTGRCLVTSGLFRLDVLVFLCAIIFAVFSAHVLRVNLWYLSLLNTFSDGGSAYMLRGISCSIVYRIGVVADVVADVVVGVVAGVVADVVVGVVIADETLLLG
jgi:hypothetical protein